MGNFVSKWVNKSLLGHQNPNDVSNKILSNPYLPKWNQMQEEYRDFNSPYYQKGRDFYSDLYGNQAMDMMATNNNIMKNKNNIESKTKRMNDLYAKLKEREFRF